MNRKDISNIKLPSSNKRNKENFPHEDFIAGIAPHLRGNNSTMYIQNPWEIKRPNNSSLNDRENEVINIDLTSNTYYNSTSNNIEIILGEEKFLLSSIDDLKTLFSKISLDKVFLSISDDKNLLPILASYIIIAEEQGVSLDSLNGSIHINVDEKQTNANYDRIIKDIITYTNTYTPKFSAITITKQPNSKPENELALLLMNGIEYIKKGIASGIGINTLISNISFFWHLETDHFKEIALMRVARMLWAKLIKPYNPNSLEFNCHCKINIVNSKKQDIFSNINNATVKAMSAVFGGTESIQINTNHNINAPISDYLTNQNIQLYLQGETHITKTVDPWAGSYYLETLTNRLANITWSLIKEIESSDNSTLHQIEQEKENIILSPTIEKPSTEPQKKEYLKNKITLKKSLSDLSNSIKNNEGNILNYALIAVKNSATFNEIIDILEKQP